ncbi:Uncharacterised protein [Mycobacteroides abscessus subsp. massiliense]|nr:Uncharacterised protein [Mycobacteroides abscessus subsp. massiliense]
MRSKGYGFAFNFFIYVFTFHFGSNNTITTDCYLFNIFTCNIGSSCNTSLCITSRPFTFICIVFNNSRLLTFHQ